MTLETLVCAGCDGPVPLDGDHIYIRAEHHHIDDRDYEQQYAFHQECWSELADGWPSPA